MADQLSQSVLAQLPSVCSFDCLRSVTGEFFLECFAGHAAFTLAVVMSQVPALRPWEITHDRRFDVLAGLPILLEGIRLGIMVAMHLGTPCQSFTMARVPAVRTQVFPLGLPDLTPSQSQLVEMGNQLASVSVKLCFALYIAGGYFSLENPERSLLWIHPDVLELFRLSGVASVLVYYNTYGALFVKPTLFLHNMPTLHHLFRPQPWPSVPLIELREWVTFQRIKNVGHYSRSHTLRSWRSPLATSWPMLFSIGPWPAPRVGRGRWLRLSIPSDTQYMG